MIDDMEYAWKIKEYLLGQIQFSDTKAATIIAISTLSISLLVALPLNNLCSKDILIIAMSCVPLILSIIFALLSIFPKQDADSNQGIIFWGHINEYNSKLEYKSAFESNTNKLEQVLTQVYFLARINNYKFKHIRMSVAFQIIGFPITWITVLLI